MAEQGQGQPARETAAPDAQKAHDLSRQSAAPPDDKGAGEAKTHARDGGMEAPPSDPIGKAPTREGYGKEAGRGPDQTGSPDAVTNERNPEPANP